MKDDGYCKRTKDWLSAMGYENLAQVRAELMRLDEELTRARWEIEFNRSSRIESHEMGQ